MRIPLLFLLAACLLAGPAEATAGAPDTVPVAITVSGGISQGSYQAGLNWALVEFFRLSHADPAFRERFSSAGGMLPPYRLMAATGASAGNINSVLSAVEWCRAENSQAPEQSVFWKVWVPTGLDQLFSDSDGEHGNDRALFHRDFFRKVHYPEIKRRLAMPARAECTDTLGIPVGLTITRVEPEVHNLSSIEISTQRFASIFAVRRRDSRRGLQGESLIFTQPEQKIREDRSLGMVVALPPDATGVIQPEHVFGLVEASSAFPLAFEPKKLKYHTFQALREDGPCAVADRPGCHPEEAEFIDGGVFDNNPLDLALGVLRWQKQRAGHSDPRIFYLDPDQLRGVLADRRRTHAVPRDAAGLDRLLLAMRGAVRSARHYELHSLYRSMARDPGYARPEWLRVTSRSMPIVGEHLYAFAAFLGRPFREYDFYVGMYDGMHLLAREVICPALHPPRDTTATTRDSVQARQVECYPGELAKLIQGRYLEVGDHAPGVMAAVYALEFPDAKRLSVPLPRDGRKAAVLASLVAANGATLDEKYTVECDGLPISEALVCANGFADLIRRFATPPVRSTIFAWVAEPGCRTRGTDLPEQCQADQVLRSLIRHPEGFSNEILRRLVHQLWRIEAGHSGHSSHKNFAEFLELSYRSVARRYTPGWEPDPSSIPDDVPARWRWMQLLPYHLAATAGQSGVEVGYRPMLHFGPQFAAVAHVIPLQFNAHERNRPQNTDHSYFGGGAGLAYKHNGLSWSGLDAMAIVMAPWSLLDDGQRRLEGRRTHLFGGEVTSYFLGGKVRASLRVLPGNGDTASNIQGGERWAMTFGLADVNGLMYWLLR